MLLKDKVQNLPPPFFFLISFFIYLLDFMIILIMLDLIDFPNEEEIWYTSIGLIAWLESLRFRSDGNNFITYASSFPSNQFHDMSPSVKCFWKFEKCDNLWNWVSWESWKS